MATGDLLESLRGASDEVFDLECGLCINDDKHIEAKHYCDNCQSYICDTCKAVHSRIPDLRKHQISPVKIQNYCGLCLAEGRKIKAVRYCKTCKSYICDTCKGSHKKFKDLRRHVFVSDQFVTSSMNLRDTSDISVQLSHQSIDSDSSACSSSNPRSPRQSSPMSTKTVDSVDGARASSSGPSTDTSTGPCSDTTTVPSTDTSVQRQTKQLADMTVRTSNKINIKLEIDTEIPWVSGCCFMPGGKVVLCDCWNSNIKILDRSFTLHDSLALQGEPWDVADLDGSNIAVTLSDSKQVQLIQLSPTVKIGHSISVDLKCYGIAVAGEVIYVSCTDDADHGQVNVYDISWNLKYKFGVSSLVGRFREKFGLGSGLFSKPWYIAVSQTGDRVFVSDCDTHIVTCLSSEGKVVWRCKDDTLTGPCGLYVDSHDNIIVCSWLNKTVDIITAEGERYKTPTMLTYRKEIVRPCSVTFRPDDQTLVVGCQYSDVIYVYKLS